MHRRRATVATAIAAIGLLFAGLELSNVDGRTASDALLARNFGSALADSDTSWSSLPPNIWLSGLGHPGAARALSPGDTITIAGKDGSPEVIEVTELSPVDGERIGVPGVQFQLVTGHSRTAAPGQVLRFMFATETPPAARALSGDRVL